MKLDQVFEMIASDETARDKNAKAVLKYRGKEDHVIEPVTLTVDQLLSDSWAVSFEVHDPKFKEVMTNFTQAFKKAHEMGIREI
jgi:hypothetical protein